MFYLIQSWLVNNWFKIRIIRIGGQIKSKVNILVLPFSFGEIQELCCNCSENEAVLVFDPVLPVVCIRIKPLIKLEGPLHFWGPLLAHLFSGLDLSVIKEEEKKSSSSAILVKVIHTSQVLYTFEKTCSSKPFGQT